jgi:lysophospholipase L1-like esterase
MFYGLIHQWWFWLVIVLVAVTTLVVFFSIKLFPSLWTTIVEYHKKPGETLVALLGDSLTEGKVGYSYISLLEQRMGNDGYSFMNAGVAADTAYNLLNRLEPVLKSQPDYVVILIGTDDVEADLRGGYPPNIVQCVKKLPQAMTPDWFGSLLRQIVLSLQSTTSAKVALCSIPILGEDLDSRPNQSVRLFNHSIKALTDELQITYLPIYETMEDFLRTHHCQAGKAFDESTSNGIMFWAVWDHHILGHSWESISARNNLLLTVDTEHFNRVGAGMVADLIESWLRKSTLAS